jgi:hypothetical protein
MDPALCHKLLDPTDPFGALLHFCSTYPRIEHEFVTGGGNVELRLLHSRSGDIFHEITGGGPDAMKQLSAEMCQWIAANLTEADYLSREQLGALLASLRAQQ